MSVTLLPSRRCYLVAERVPNCAYRRNRGTLFSVDISILDRSIDWPAWVQAVGSVLAILGAIWIDRGSARRAVRAKQQDETDAYTARRRAISNCIVSLEGLVNEAAVADFEPTGYWSVSEVTRRRMRAALMAASFYRDDPREVSALLRVTLTHIVELFRPVVERWDGRGGYTQHGRDQILEQATTTLGDMHQLLSELDAGVW